MATRFLGCLLMVVMVLGSGLTANAQSKSTDPFIVSVGIGGEVTDNRDSVPDDDAEGNTDLFVAPRIDANLFGETSLWVLHYMPQFRWRSDPGETQNDTELFHDFGVDYLKKGAVTDLRMIEQFNITDDPAIESAGETLRRDSSYTMNRLELGMTHDFTDRSQFDLEGNHMIKSYDDELRAVESDEDSLGATGTYSYKLTPQTLAAAVLDATMYGYKSNDEFNRDFDSLRFGGGFDHMFTPEFRAGFRAGMQEVEYDDDSMEAENMPFLRVALAAGQEPNLRLTSAFNVAVGDSDIFPFSSQDETELYGLLEGNVGESQRTVLGLLALIRTDSFDSDQLPDGGAEFQRALGFGTSGDRDSLVVEGSILWRVGEEGLTNIRLAQRFEDVTSDVSYDYTRNSTTVFVTRQF